MSLGEVDTLNLLVEKLENLFNESQGYHENLLDANSLYKSGKLSDKEFFAKLGDCTIAYSSLEFLAIKVLLEMKKSLDSLAGGRATGNTQSPGLMPGMGSPGMAGGMAGGMVPPPRLGTPDSPVGAPPRIVSTQQDFGQPGTLPSPDPSLVSAPQTLGGCTSCGATIRQNAKFCTKCGAKV